MLHLFELNCIYKYIQIHFVKIRFKTIDDLLDFDIVFFSNLLFLIFINLQEKLEQSIEMYKKNHQ